MNIPLKDLFENPRKKSNSAFFIALIFAVISGWAGGQFHAWADEKDEVLIAPPLITGLVTGWASATGAILAKSNNPAPIIFASLAGPIVHEYAQWNDSHKDFQKRLELFKNKFPADMSYPSSDEILYSNTGHKGLFGYMLFRHQFGAYLSFLGKFRMAISPDTAYTAEIITILLSFSITVWTCLFMLKSVLFCKKCGEPVLRKELGHIELSNKITDPTRMSAYDLEPHFANSKTANPTRMDAIYCPHCDNMSALISVKYEKKFGFFPFSQICKATKRKSKDIIELANSFQKASKR